MSSWVKLPDFLEDYLKNRTNTTMILFSAVAVIFVSYVIKNYIYMRGYFKRMNIPGPRPWPLVGNFLSVIRKGVQQNDIELRNKYGKTIGYFEGSQPVILTTDVKFLKLFLIKDFSSFVNRRRIESFTIEPLDKFLTVLKDDEWKNARSILTTTFTSGKLKSMSKCITSCIKNYNKYLEEAVQKDGVIATKTFYGSYTLDVISSCCFGMDINSIGDPDNEFLKNLQIVFSAGFQRNYRLLLIFIAPKLSLFLAKRHLMEFFPRKPLKFLEQVTNTIIDRRKAKLDVRDDFIQSMIEHEENMKTDNKETANGEGEKSWNGYLRKTLSKSEILCQAILFFLAGYETTANTLEFLSYNLAKSPDIQEKLIEEVDRVLEKHNGEVNYDSIHEMKYMDMVIDESLRIFPPATRTDRTANADYEYEGMKIKKGQVVAVPIYALHHDPDIYPNPEVFDPERFSDENKKKRDNVAFLPFGAGPRNCIGMRFALIEIKLLLSSILSKYRFTTCDKTPEKIMLAKVGLTKSLNPIYVKVEKR